MMRLLLWFILIAMVSIPLFPVASCSCGDSGEGSDDDSDDDTDWFPDDDGGYQPDEYEASCDETAFYALCIVSFLGICSDVTLESDFHACTDYCQELDSNPIGVEDKYCVCCSWFPWEWFN